MPPVSRVIVLCPKGRRQTVNLTLNSNILQILEEVCQKQNLNPDDFDVCHYKKPLDLSLPVRFANLSNNAQLELQPVKVARKECLVTVGLHLESGERIMKDFVPSTSVWNVVEQCLNTKQEKVQLEEGREPVCIYMRQKLVGNEIKETTLRDLGLTTGSAIIRLLYRNLDDLSDQAHVSTPLSQPPRAIPTYPDKTLSSDVTEMECDSSADTPKPYSGTKNALKDTKSASVSSRHEALPSSCIDEKNEELNQNMVASKEKLVDHNVTGNVPHKEAKTVGVKMINDVNENTPVFPQERTMELDSANLDQVSSSEEEIGTIHYIGGRHAVIYSLNDITVVKKADLPDEFFDLKIEDVKYLMEVYRKTRKEMENQPLLTRELRDRQLKEKLGRFKQTVIRVYFPERLVLQAVFEAGETVQDVCDFVRNYLEDKSLNFYLYTTPPIERKDPSKTLIESMLIPAAVVYFGCDKQIPKYLMETLKEKVSDPRAAALAAYEARKEAMREIEEIQNEQLAEMTDIVEEPEVKYDMAPGPSITRPLMTTEKVPKWMKLSRK